MIIGTKLEFKFAIFKDGCLNRWENFPMGENRTYRPRYFRVTLEFSEAVAQFKEGIDKRFVSSASLESKFIKINITEEIDLDEYTKIKGKKTFNPFVTAQDSLVTLTFSSKMMCFI